MVALKEDRAPSRIAVPVRGRGTGRWLRHAAIALVTAATAAAALAQDRYITVASTTSTEQSGLFAELLPAFTKKTGIGVRVVAVGTGQALDIGRRGDADALFVHDQTAEEKFVAEGHGLERRPVMYNDFVIVGPKNDPAGVKGRDVVQALHRLASSKAAFVSRADKSGTYAAELRYWKLAGVAVPPPAPFDYKACGCGMGPALNIASSTGAYALTDRGTWLSFRNRGDLAVLVEGDRRLFNQYGVIVIDPAKHPGLKTALAQAFSDWLVSADGQATIAAYKIGGEQLFFPNAER